MGFCTWYQYPMPNTKQEVDSIAASTLNNAASSKRGLNGWANRFVARVLEWESAKSQRAGRACYRAYTRLFVPLAVLVLAALPLGGRELIWNFDGLNQYYAFFIYEGEWIRGIVSGLLSGQGLNVPLWEWNSGYGSDIPTTFDVFFDPLNLVSAITPQVASEWVFQLLVVVRMYLGGLAFAFFANTRGESRTGIVLGALLYALCGTALVGQRWASGLHAFILFPVILAGAERVLAGRKPWVFVASLTALAVVSYYFTFSAVVLLVGYLVVRVVMVERPNLTAVRFLRWVGVFAGLSLLCAVLAAFSLVPAAVALLGIDRFTEGQAGVPLLYSLDYYLNLAATFVSTNDQVSDIYLGYGGLAFFGCVALFLQKGANRELKLVFVVLTAFFLFPFVGSFFNGMNYPTNRWAWAYTLCVAFILARMTPRLLAADARDKRVFALATAVYALFFLIPAYRVEANVAGFAALLVALVALCASMEHDTRRNLVGGALALTLVVNGFYFLSPSEGGQGASNVPLGSAYAKLTTGSLSSVALDAHDDSWWRYDAPVASAGARAPISRIANNSMVLGLSGIDFYNTVYDNGVDAFHTELAIVGDYMNFRYLSLQNRSDLQALLGVKYYAFRNDGTDTAPYGFDAASPTAARQVMGIDYQLVPATASLPVGFAFDQAISRDDYLALSPVQRQQALLQAVVLDGEADRAEGAQLVGADTLAYEDTAVLFTVESADGTAVEDGRFVALRDGASVTLTCEGVPRAETYLYLKGLHFTEMKPSELAAGANEGKPWYYQVSAFVQDLSREPVKNYELAIKGDAADMTAYLFNETPNSNTCGGKDEWLANLGFSEKPVRTITVSFSQAGAYEFEDLQVVAETRTHYAAHVEALSDAVLENANLGCNTLTGTVSLDAPETLLITVAHGQGWTAYVDGQPAELLRADTAFMGIDLPAGTHDIELRYFTPGLPEGLAITGIGILALVALVFALRRQSKAKE